MKRFAFLIWILCLGAPAHAATYYVSYLTGNDSNPGTEVLPLKYHPWMGEFTGSVVPAAGDTIYMNRGETWAVANPANTNGFIETEAAGTAGNLITTTAYGAGALPVISITSAATTKNLFRVLHDYIAVDSLKLQHSVSTYDVSYDKVGIYITNTADHVYVTACEIASISMGIVAYNDCYEIHIGNESATSTATETAYSNYIHDFAYAAIMIHGRAAATSEVFVYYNYIIDGGLGAACLSNVYGISITVIATSTAWPKNVYVRYNLIKNIPWEGLSSHGGDTCYWEHNRTYNVSGNTWQSTDAGFGKTAATLYIRYNELDNPAAPLCLTTTCIPAIISEWTPFEFVGNLISFDARPAEDMAGFAALQIQGDSTLGSIVRNVIENGPSTGSDAAIYLGVAGYATLTIERNKLSDYYYGLYIRGDQDSPNVLNFWNNLIEATIPIVITNADLAFTINLYNNTLYAASTAVWEWSGNGIAATSTVNVKNNIFTFATSQSAPYIHSTGANAGALTVDYNLYYNSSTANPFDPPGAAATNWAGWQALGYDASGISGSDPLFMNPAGNDYHLQGGSPVRNIGISLAGSFTVDLENRSRPQGAGWDIGAYELVLSGAFSVIH